MLKPKSNFIKFRIPILFTESEKTKIFEAGIVNNIYPEYVKYLLIKMTIDKKIGERQQKACDRR